MAEKSGEAVDKIASMVRQALPWFASCLDIIAPAVPFFAPVFVMVTKAYGAACAMQQAREDAGGLAEGIRELAENLAKV